jgi:hypothetical protein
MLEYYIWFSLRSRSLQYYLLLLPFLLYLGCGLSYILYGLHSCRSLSFIILLQVMIPRLRAASLTTGQRTQYLDSCDLFIEVRDTSTDADTPARRQPSAIRVETRRC